MKKIVITGALGHIGSQFIHNIKPGIFNEVVLFDNLSTQRYVSLFNLPKKTKFTFIEGDVCKDNLVKIFIGADVVLHLAAITNAAGSFDIQDQVENVNFEGSKRVALACVETGAKLIFLSTTSVYGTQEKLVSEDCSEAELQPQSPYAVSKLKAEKYLTELAKESNLKFIICRFGTIFGTSIGMRFHTAINKFCWQACMNLPITVWRTALNQKRPYLELNDAIKTLQFIIEKELFDNEVYNVLTTNTTVGEIVESIKKWVPDLKVELVDTKIMNQLSYEVSCEKFKKTGFIFSGNLENNIKQTIKLLDNRI